MVFGVRPNRRRRWKLFWDILDDYGPDVGSPKPYPPEEFHRQAGVGTIPRRGLQWARRATQGGAAHIGFYLPSSAEYNVQPTITGPVSYSLASRSLCLYLLGTLWRWWCAKPMRGRRKQRASGIVLRIIIHTTHCRRQHTRLMPLLCTENADQLRCFCRTSSTF